LAFYIFLSLMCVASLCGIAISLKTGKTMTPLRGTQPFIVDRSQQPGRFWGGVISLGVFAAICAGMMLATIFDRAS
jgi:hypothetical protein